MFPSLEIAETHYRMVHAKNKDAWNGQNSNGTTAATLLPCNLCDNTFQQRAHLLQHLKAYHGVSNPERRFLDNPFMNNSSPSPAPRLIAAKPRPKLLPVASFHHNSEFTRSVRPQSQSLLRVNPTPAGNHHATLGNLMGLINKGSISLSISTIGN